MGDDAPLLKGAFATGNSLENAEAPVKPVESLDGHEISGRFAVLSQRRGRRHAACGLDRPFLDARRRYLWTLGALPLGTACPDRSFEPLPSGRRDGRASQMSGVRIAVFVRCVRVLWPVAPRSRISPLCAGMMLLSVPPAAPAAQPEERSIDLSAFLPREVTEEELRVELTAAGRQTRGGLLLLRAWLRQQLGATDRALKDLRRVEGALGPIAEVHALRGSIFAEQAEWRRADLEFSAAIALDPDSWRLYLARGVARGMLDDGNAAEADLDRSLALNSKVAKTFGLRGYLRFKRRQWEAAQADFTRAVELDPDELRTWSALASTYSMQGREAEAESTLTRALERYPDHPALSLDRGLARASLNRRDDALSDLDRAIGGGAGTAWAHYQRGQLRQQKADPAGALADYELATKLDPSLSLAWSRVGDMLARKNEIPAALAAHRRALELDPKSATGFGLRGRTHRLAGNFQAELQDYEQALRFDPKYPFAQRGRAWALLILGRWSEAAAAFEKLQTAYPRKPDFDALNRWMALARAGRRGEGEAALAAALEGGGFTGPDDWARHLAKFALGRLPEAALLARASSGEEGNQAGRRCEAWYYVGLIRLLSSDPAGAAQAWRNCRAENQPDFIEHNLAEMELKRLSGHRR